MRFKFITKRKWIREGIFSLLYLLIIIFFSIYFFFKFDVGGSTYLISCILLIAIFLGWLNKAIYYLTLHKKDYLILEDSSLSIHRGNIIPRKIIQFNQVESVAEINGIILFKRDNGKEEQIYTEWLSNEDAIELKNEISHRFGPKASVL